MQINRLLTMQRCALHSLSSPSPSHKGRGRRRMGLRLSGSSGNSVAGKDGIPFGPLLLLPVRSGLIPSKLFMKIWGRPQTDENQNGQALLTQPAADLCHPSPCTQPSPTQLCAYQERSLFLCVVLAHLITQFKER